MYRSVWITQGWYEDEWWRKAEGASCNSDTIESFIEQQRVITISFYPSATGEDEEAYIHIVSLSLYILSPCFSLTPVLFFNLLSIDTC